MPFCHNLSTPERASKNVYADVGVKRYHSGPCDHGANHHQKLLLIARV